MFRRRRPALLCVFLLGLLLGGDLWCWWCTSSATRMLVPAGLRFCGPGEGMRPPAEGEELFVDLDRLSDEQRADLRRRLGLLGGDFNRELALEWATLKLALCAALAGCCAWALRAGGGSPGFRAVLFGAGVILLAGLAIFLRFGLYLALEELRPVLSWAAPGAYPALERSWQSGWRLWWLCTAASGSLALGLAALLTCARNSPRAGSTAGPGALGMSREPR